VRSLSDGWDAALGQALEERREQGLLRRLRPLDGVGDVVVTADGRQLLNLSSNDYLGLAGDPRLAEAAARGARRGAGATSSRLIVGTDAACLELEQRVAAFAETEAALVFTSGYQANVGAIAALVGPEDAVFSDALNHASIIDGCRLSRAAVHRYAHADVEELEALLRASPARRRLIVTESVFSMDGDVAPLAEIAELKERHGAALLVDEAHGVGVFGPRGAGLLHELGVAEHADLQLGTFSKAFGCSGAYLAGRRTWIDYLVNTCRSFVFTTGLPPAAVGAAAAAIEAVEQADDRRAALAAKAERFRGSLAEAGLDTCGSSTQIVPVLVGKAAAAVDASAALEADGVLGVAIRPPTVPPGTSRIRFSLKSTHTDEALERALAAIRAAIRPPVLV
jgi:8-amino-7-oxononanoate synthase